MASTRYLHIPTQLRFQHPWCNMPIHNKLGSVGWHRKAQVLRNANSHDTGEIATNVTRPYKCVVFSPRCFVIQAPHVTDAHDTLHIRSVHNSIAAYEGRFHMIHRQSHRPCFPFFANKRFQSALKKAWMVASIRASGLPNHVQRMGRAARCCLDVLGNPPFQTHFEPDDVPV